MGHKIAKNDKEAWDMQETYEGKPHGWVQWKGTNVCIDIHCKCGSHLHFDKDFLYNVKCLDCSTTYMVNGHVELIEVLEPDSNCIHAAKDDHDEPPENYVPTTRESVIAEAAKVEAENCKQSRYWKTEDYTNQASFVRGAKFADETAGGRK